MRSDLRMTSLQPLSPRTTPEKVENAGYSN
jgi:hypothetical protein